MTEAKINYDCVAKWPKSGHAHQIAEAGLPQTGFMWFLEALHPACKTKGHMAMTRITTERLVLRPFQQNDLEDLHAVFSDPETMKYWSTLPHTDPAETFAFIDGTMKLAPKAGRDFVVELDGRIIGKMGFWRFPEIGFIFHRNNWGQGIAREAAGAVIEHGFQTCGLSQITADVDPRNLASIKLLERLGFRETGRAKNTTQIGSLWYDSIYFALDKPKK